MTTLLALALLHGPAVVGGPAPDFSLPAIDGKTIALEGYKGRFVVLEWTNKDCPFVKKHYGSGSMQATQAEATKRSAVWLTVCSSAPGNQGYMTAEQFQAYAKEKRIASTAVLLDADGKVGHLYNARTTPQIVVIDPKGTIVYNGAIDDRPDPDPESLKGAKNYALAALTEAMAGKTVAVATSRPYGCSVKYKE